MLMNLRNRLRSESGFTLVVVMGAMLVLTLFTVATFAAVNSDQPLSHRDIARKKAYSAAEAGIADYLFHLNQDNTYWTNCTGVPSPNAVNNVWNGTGTDTRTRWRTVPGGTSTYAIELLPASPYTACTTGANVAASMIDPQTRSLRIRSTGKDGTIKRSVIAQMRKRGFLDYVWFTDYETYDSVWYTRDVEGRPTANSSGKSLEQWAAENCLVYYRNGRPTPSWTGKYTDVTPNVNAGTFKCKEINFIDDDNLQGPMHTNDELLASCSPTFGRNLQDRIESGNSIRKGGGCGSSENANVLGTQLDDQPILSLPPSNASLENDTDTAYRFTGKTTIVLNPTNITITNAAAGLTNAVWSYPPNGVIYVKNGTCGYAYEVLDPYNDVPTGGTGAPSGCGDVWVKGTYGNPSLTIASQRDIILNGDVKLNSGDDGMLGLIADNFIRVWHPGTHGTGSNIDTCTNGTGSNAVGDREIDAAMLSLNRSFTVDNYYCGNPLGDLTVKGTIAQKYRGAVGTGNISTGYIKDYRYDDRLAYRSPPHFLDPIQSAWHVTRYTEQTDAR